MFFKQAHDDKNFEPLYVEKIQSKVGLTTRKPYLTIPKYGQYGQKMDFPIDFIFRKCTFLNEARDDKNFEPSYAYKSQFLADLAAKMFKKRYF